MLLCSLEQAQYDLSKFPGVRSGHVLWERRAPPFEQHKNKYMCRCIQTYFYTCMDGAETALVNKFWSIYQPGTCSFLGSLAGNDVWVCTQLPVCRCMGCG